MKRVLFFSLLIAFSLEGFLKKSRRSRHGEDCYSNAACEEGLLCKLNRCYTKYESQNLKELGLYETNICDLNKKCKGDLDCVKHRCVDKNTPLPEKTTHSEDIESVHLVFAGGINLNKKPYNSGIKKDGSINYDHLFTHISKNIKSADLGIISQDRAYYINTKEQKITKNPNNTPKELGDAIYKAGFRVVLHASSSIYSLKEEGILNTINFWRINYPDVRPLGIASTLEESNNDYYIFTKNNVKIGIINYSSFIGTNIPSQNKYMVNIISKKKVEENVSKIKSLVDCIIVCINWGKKTKSTPNNSQIGWAKYFASIGVNIIIGYYPLYTQPVTYVKADNGKTALVFFSLGYLVNDNEKKTSDLGALANIVISKVNDKAYISSYHLIPTVNHKTKEEYTVYKLSEYNEDLAKEVKKNDYLKQLKKECKTNMGVFAHCD
jgi:poly-gamma-glutamate synthesis protein (capsule biosynthesis protein)